MIYGNRPTTTVSYVERGLAMVRDVMIIILCFVVLAAMFRLSTAVDRLGNQLENAGVEQTVPPLPQDRCGGGVC